MKYIKLFEGFDESEDYIVNSIRDILIELEDEGMEIEIVYQPHSLGSKGNKMPGVTIEIKGNLYLFFLKIPLIISPPLFIFLLLI